MDRHGLTDDDLCELAVDQDFQRIVLHSGFVIIQRAAILLPVEPRYRAAEQVRVSSILIRFPYQLDPIKAGEAIAARRSDADHAECVPA